MGGSYIPHTHRPWPAAHDTQNLTPTIELGGEEFKYYLHICVGEPKFALSPTLLGIKLHNSLIATLKGDRIRSPLHSDG